MFLVQHIDGRKVRRNHVVCNFASCSSKWVVVVIVVIFSRVPEIPDTLYLERVCVISWPHKRFIQKSASWFFNTFLARGINIPRYVSISSVGVDFCMHGPLLVPWWCLFFCVWQLMRSVMQHSGSVFSFDATRLSVFCTMCVLT